MTWAARILLIGILAVVIIVVLASAIQIAAPYVAIGMVSWILGKSIWRSLRRP